MKKARIHSFQSLGAVDGPGVRTVIFMQGCPLRCICCHNPDTWDPRGGEETDVPTLVSKIMRYRTYYGTTGGVTVSGGEPLMQAEFVTALFRALHEEGIHTALDTSGYRLDADTKKLLAETDLVLLDYKYTTDEDYVRYVGCTLSQVESFLEYLNEIGCPTWVRQVLLPGKNDNDESLCRLSRLSKKYPCIKKTELLPFRKLCKEKYERLGIAFPAASVPEPSADVISTFCLKYGFS